MTSSQQIQIHTADGETVSIPYHLIGEGDKRPGAVFVAGLHGDELNGVFVLSRLAAFLNAVAEGAHPHQRLRERVIIVPTVNIMGFQHASRNWPTDGDDINRAFPGDENGTTAQRIAKALLDLTRSARYRVDIHSSNAAFEELPQIRLYEPNDDERASACLFGLPAVIERPGNEIFASTLASAWQRLDEENFVIQVGYAGDLQLHHCERLFSALLAFLQHAGILEGKALSEEEEDLHYFGESQALPLTAEYTGLFVTKLQVGRWLQAGEVIGTLYDAHDGSIRDEIKTPVSGLLSGLRRQPVVLPGDLLARVHLRDASSSDDSPFHAQGQ